MYNVIFFKCEKLSLNRSSYFIPVGQKATKLVKNKKNVDYKLAFISQNNFLLTKIY